MDRNPAPPRRGRGDGGPSLATAFLFACLAIGSSVGALFLSPGGEVSRGSWRGYTTLLAEDSLAEADVLSALTEAGFRNIISSSTEPVLVSNWIDLETLPLGTVLERLVKGDPRRDGYIESLASWFAATVGGRNFRVYYIPGSSPQLTGKKLAKALEPFRDRIVLPDEAPSSSREPKPARGGGSGFFVALLVLAAAAATGALRDAKAPKLRFTQRLASRLVLVAPWIIASYSGLPVAAVASFWGLALVDAAAGLDLPLAEYARTGSFASAFDSLKRQALPPIALLASAIVATVIEPGPLPALGLALIGSIAGAAALAVIARMSRVGETRVLFVPKPIAAPPRSWSAASPWSAALACLIVGFWLLGLHGPGGGAPLPGGSPRQATSLAYPRPFAVEGSARPGLAEAKKRAEASGRDRLPDLGSWLEHRAIQEALPYERVGSPRLDPFGPVAVSRPGGEVVPLRFDEEWARSAYKSIPQASVEGMLLAQGGSVAAFSLSGPAGTGKGRPLAPIEVLRYIFLLIPPLGRIAAGLRAQRGSGADETRQEA